MCHPLLDFDKGMNIYSDARLPHRRMLAHPIDTARSGFFFSFFFHNSTAKYFHSSKWGSIPIYPLHSTMQAEIC